MYKLSEKITTFIDPANIDENAIEQIKNLSEMPFIFKHIAVMPDCHLGKGATVGSVVATHRAIMPATVGVDIGCGMIAVRTPFKREVLGDLKALRIGIERRIPCLGRMPVYNSKIQETAKNKVNLLESYADIDKINPDMFSPKWRLQLGSLGGGNHFIEITLDEEENVWVFLHSGSRGVGNKIAMHFIKLAQKFCEKNFIQLKDNDLAYLVEGGEGFTEYISYLKWAQEFAFFNRKEMMDRVLDELNYTIYGKSNEEKRKKINLEEINCHHNFTQQENHFGTNVYLTRKGAISADKGKLGLIPGSMGTASYIVEGLGNKMSFNSSPHGAGRNFSRTEARRRFTMKDYDKAMVGIEARRDDSLLDEIPQAYKDIEEVMENAKELVTIKHTLKQILNVKGD